MNTGSQLPRSKDRPLISRTTIAILASILIGMGLGAKLPHESSQICLAFGALGLCSYVGFEIVARWRTERNQVRLQRSAEKMVESRIKEFRNRMHTVPSL